MDLIKKIKENEFIHVLLFIIFTFSGLIVSLTQIFLFLCLYKISKNTYRRINYYLLWTFYAEFTFLAEWWAGVEMKAYLNKSDYEKYFGKEKGVCVMNHSYENDWLLGFMYNNKMSILGSAKCYVKKVLQYIPIIGWIWYFGDFIMLERSFEKDEKTIKKQIAEIADYPYPGWLLLFPEGSRFEKTKHINSIKYAKEKGLPVFKHLLTPRTKGFITSLPPMKGKMTGFYDITLAFSKDEKYAPNVTNLLLGRKMTGHCLVTRVPFETIPESKEDQEKLIFEMFAKKDAMLESFQRTGDFFKESGVEPTDTILDLKGGLDTLLNFVGWATVVSSGLLYYLYHIILAKNYTVLFIFVVVYFLMAFALKRLLKMSKVTKGTVIENKKEK